MITVYGASDDLIEVEGDIHEEFNPHDENPSLLALSDGSVLSIVYDKEGIWRINRIVNGSGAYSKVEATDPDGDYTDRVTIDADIAWVVFGSRIERRAQGKR